MALLPDLPEISIRFLSGTEAVSHRQDAVERRALNITSHILIEDGRQHMNEVYEKLVKEKRDAALTVTPFLPAEQKENKR